jgi:predicted acyl esterase
MQRLRDLAPELDLILTRGSDAPVAFEACDIHLETTWVRMRDGIRLATDLYLPPRPSAPTIAVRTPYGRSSRAETFVAFAQRGYVVISQDCRGTGDSESDTWDYFIYEPEDGIDLIEWVIRQKWFDGFLGACGGSYLAATQWCMGVHPRMSTIVPEVGGLEITFNTTRYYMFLNAYARSVGKGAGKVSVHYSDMERRMADETMSGGYFNEPMCTPLSKPLLSRYPHLRKLSQLDGKRWLWKHCSSLGPARRAELIKLALGVTDFTFVDMQSLYVGFGRKIAYGAHSIPCVEPYELVRSLRAPALLITGWYDWGLNDTLATWDLLTREAPESMRSRSRLLITPSAHNLPGYHEGKEQHFELERSYRTPDILDLLLRWYAAVRDNTTESWPAVMYYLMGENEWRASSAWPPPNAQACALHLGASGLLTSHPPHESSAPDTYVYHPDNPTPTVGGSIVSYVYPPGSVDVSEVQQRPDVMTYTTAPLERCLDVVGPVRMILYASSSAIDTDFSARLSDVFPDGRAIQLQSGILRARYRISDADPAPLEPGRIYRFEIDMWSTANRFRAGHCLRLDISSADFPRFDRNSNRGGEPGPPISAMQSIYHDSEHPSHLLVSVLRNPS